MKKKKLTLGKTFGFSFLALFFLMNIMAYNHAKKFTRYCEPNGEKRSKLEKLSAMQKAGIVLSGINNPKPQLDSVPHVPYKTVQMGTDRKLEAWHLQTDTSKGTVIIFHGYSGTKSPFVPHAEIIQRLGWDALVVDFYGCGGSEGSESTIGFKEALDVKTSYDYIKSKSTKPVVLFGSSMGAAAIMKAVSENTVAPEKIILECPFGNMRSAVEARVTAMGAPSFPFTDLFMFWGGIQNNFWAYNHNPEDYAKKISIPTLLMYGEKDARVPRSETDLIFKNLQGEKQLVTFPECGHELYLEKYTPEWTEAVNGFLK